MTSVNFFYTELRKFHGSMAIVARRAKVHRNTVQAVLQGKWRNDDVLKVAKDVLIELKAKEQARAEMLEDMAREVQQAAA